MKTLIYLHGFNSSPQSQKARQAKCFFQAESREFDIVVPVLPPEPLLAIDHIKSLVSERGKEHVAGFIGSSLGGYYALYLHQYFSLPSVLINPAVRPYELLSDYIGENTNLYTGETYSVEPSHMDDLRILDVAPSLDSKQLYLIAQTGDEVLDYRQAVSLMPRAKMWISSGGDHSFQNFEVVLPSIRAFFQTT